MQTALCPESAFVVKPEELFALNYLAQSCPRPQSVEWINRGTNQKLRPSSIDMLLRTLFQDVASPSVVRLHRTSGLRVMFRSEREREKFAAAFAEAQARNKTASGMRLSAIFNNRNSAERAVAALTAADVPESAISLLWRASQFLDTDFKWPAGHSMLSVAAATGGGGLAGATLGVLLLAVPGVGQVAA
ncbi:MAG: hypothetical protein WCY11_21260, partial [Novosphingobium sp.]